MAEEISAVMFKVDLNPGLQGDNRAQFIAPQKRGFEMVRRFAFSFALLLTVMMLVFSDWALSVETVTMSTIEQSVAGRLSMFE